MKYASNSALIEMFSLPYGPFISQLYWYILARDPDPTGIQFYLQRLHETGDRISVARDLVRSAEFVRLGAQGRNIPERDVDALRHLIRDNSLATTPLLKYLLRPALSSYREFLKRVSEAEQAGAKTLLETTPQQCDSQYDVGVGNSQAGPEVQIRRREYGHFEHVPLVSVIIVSYNSRADLEILLPSIASQTYSNFEVILIENGDEDNEACFKAHFPCGKYIKAKRNSGFAAGNNLGVSVARGELFALINPDTFVDRDWLLELVDSLRRDSSAAVCVPRIRFMTQFVDYFIESDGEIALDGKHIDCGLRYKKWFCADGQPTESGLVTSTAGRIRLRLPVDESSFKLPVRITEGSYCRTYFNRAETSASRIMLQNSDDIILDVDLSAHGLKWPFWVINNAGSMVGEAGPFDRGYGEPDEGQYDGKAYVDALCGCSALIRRQSILGRDLFLEELFAYYEDAELSDWIRARGDKILYVPRSNVYHRHSATSQQGSPLWKTLVARGKLMYDYRTGRLQAPLSSLRVALERSIRSDIPPSVAMILHELNDRFIESGVSGACGSKRVRVAIYNSYWNTFGGGEAHALAVASHLQNEVDLYLVSENDFDVDALSKYFNIDLKDCTKLVCPIVDGPLTSEFDVFINSTFRSNLVSEARLSYYIVFFPHIDFVHRMLSCYRFLHMSKYTADWTAALWGQHQWQYLVPLLGLKETAYHAATGKENVMMSIGRINREGHCKNHHIIIEAFKKWLGSNPGDNWKLLIVGSYNPSNAAEREYMRTLNEQAKGFPIEIVPNCDRDVLAGRLSKAKIYIHATGYGTDPLSEPHLHEHFGITVYEAMMSGCVPIVYDVGGPADTVRQAGIGLTFSSLNELVSAFGEAARMWRGGKFDYGKAREWVISQIGTNRNNMDDLKNEILSTLAPKVRVNS